MHFGTKSWSKMVVRWCYANLFMEWSRDICVLNAWSTYATYLSMTRWLLLHWKNDIAALWSCSGRPGASLLGQDVVASLLSLCMAKWLRKWWRGWLYVRSNTKAQSLYYQLSPVYSWVRITLGLTETTNIFCIAWEQTGDNKFIIHFIFKNNFYESSYLRSSFKFGSTVSNQTFSTNLFITQQ